MDREKRSSRLHLDQEQFEANRLPHPENPEALSRAGSGSEPRPDDETPDAMFDDGGALLHTSGEVRGNQQMQNADDQFGAKPHQGWKHRGRS